MYFEEFDDRKKENYLNKFRTAMQNKVSRKMNNFESSEDLSI